MTINRAPIGWRNPHFLTDEEKLEMLHGNVPNEKRELAIRKFMMDYMNFSKSEIKEFLFAAIKEYLQVIPDLGVPAHSKKEAIWLAHMDLIHAAAWEEENEEFQIIY